MMEKSLQGSAFARQVNWADTLRLYLVTDEKSLRGRGLPDVVFKVDPGFKTKI
jgi:hypothetical protein